MPVTLSIATHREPFAGPHEPAQPLCSESKRDELVANLESLMASFHVDLDLEGVMSGTNVDLYFPQEHYVVGRGCVCPELRISGTHEHALTALRYYLTGRAPMLGPPRENAGERGREELHRAEVIDPPVQAAGLAALAVIRHQMPELLDRLGDLDTPAVVGVFAAIEGAVRNAIETVEAP